MTTSKDIWILSEHSEGKAEDLTLELITKGRSLADELKAMVCVATIGARNETLADTLAQFGADTVYFLDNPLLSEYSIERHVDALSGLLNEKEPEILLCGSTIRGSELAFRLAARLKTGLVTNCVSLSLDEEGNLLQTKLTHGGKVSTTHITPNSRPQMVTVRAGVMDKAKPDATRKPEVIEYTPQIPHREPRIRVTKSFIKADPTKISLDEADGIVAGGRGMGSAEGFQLLGRLAKRLGMVVAGSLPAIDEGWLPRNKQVGQTGMTVSPDLYIACGISGSNYHILGMKDSKAIIAINIDRNAPIFKVADMGIVGDVFEIIPAIIDQLGERSAAVGEGDETNDDAREI